MQVSCLQENLNRALTSAMRVVPSRSALPVATHILLATDRSMLKVSGTNLETTLSSWVGAMVDEEGAIAVPGRVFSEYIRSLPADRVDLTVDPDSEVLRVQCGKDTARIHCTAASSFPPVAEVEGEVIRLDPEQFRQALARVVICAAKEESRPVLTALKLLLEGNSLTLAAADGFRLAVYKGELANPLPEDMVVDALPPASFMREVQRQIQPDERLDLRFNEARKVISFRTSGMELTSQLLSGTFPNYDQLIPDKHDTLSTFSADRMREGIQRAVVFVRSSGSDIIRMVQQPLGEDADPTDLPLTVLSAKSEEVGEVSSEIVMEELEGKENRIAFAGRYLLDVLTVLGKETVTMAITQSSSPGVFRIKDNDEYTHVIMPMFVQW